MATVSDLDGTLLDSGGGREPHLSRLLRSARLPRPLVFATSRPLADVRRIFSFLDEPYYIVSNDGAACYEVSAAGELGLLHTLTLANSGAEVKEALERSEGIAPLLFCFGDAGELVLMPDDPRQNVEPLQALTPDREYRTYAAPTVPAGDLERARAISFFVREADRCLAERAAEFWRGVLPDTRTISYADTRLPGCWWVEVVHRRLDKLRGVEQLQRLGVIGPAFLALGNAWNDVAMLSAARHSVVPADAEPEAKQAAGRTAPVPGGALFCQWLFDEAERWDHRCSPTE